ncbi:MAG: S41 family peptidase, partial [Bacteroidota bacterium]
LTPEELAKKLTQDLRALNGDLHLFVNFHKQEKDQHQEAEPKPQDHRGASTNFGFQEIKFLEHKIAYLKIEHFSNWNHATKARQKVSELMSLFKNSQALIIDVRDNRGGVPYIASCLASYFFGDTAVHLADFYTRYNNYSYGIYTEPFVPGVKLAEIPLFILVNEKSASAAEELAFWMQNHERALIIGQATAGAGYGALNHNLNERFSVSISSEEEIDPLSKKGFQGSGVIPDRITTEGNSLDVAIELAKESVKKVEVPDSSRLKSFYQLLENDKLTINESEIYEQVLTLIQMELLSYDELYSLGNTYIDEPQKSVPILTAFTSLYSFYPHPFELYAKALIKAKDYDAALENFDKAIELANLKNNPAIKQFRLSRKEFLDKYGGELKE